jgi:hypothetical protein
MDTPAIQPSTLVDNAQQQQYSDPALVPAGTRRDTDGGTRVFYEGYWMKTYPVPGNTLAFKKTLIEALTRRLFNHTEHGLNVPGSRLEAAKHAYETETDPALKRVKGAMYAGAMFNRATDIFRGLVELQEVGVEIASNNELMRECGRRLQEAYGLCRLVLHRSGEESIDELWGEPFRAFSLSVEDYYEARYLKIGQTKRDIDRIADVMVETFTGDRLFANIGPLVRDFAHAAKIKSETLRTDPEIFEVWANFVAAAERLVAYEPVFGPSPVLAVVRRADSGKKLLCNGRDLIYYITRARVPMPKSTADYIARCGQFRQTGSFTQSTLPMPA